VGLAPGVGVDGEAMAVLVEAVDEGDDAGGAGKTSWRGISRFTALLTELGIDQMVAEDKEHNGKVEVFNANLRSCSIATGSMTWRR
jgi:hypothetical protein